MGGILFNKGTRSVVATENFESISSDFDFYVTSPLPPGDGQTSLVLHSNPPLEPDQLNINPLAFGGAACRKFNSGVHKMYYKPSVYDGAFYNIPITKAISFRACLRRFTTVANGIRITAKDISSFTNNFTLGYSFGIYNNRIAFFAGTNLIVQSPNGIPSNTWFSLRMDVVSLSPTSDSVKCYFESSPGSDIWTTTYDSVTWEFTCTTGNGQFVNWSNNGRNGIFVDGNAGNDVYVDKMQFEVYTPIT